MIEYIMMNTEEQAKLLEEAFWECDIGKLSLAIDSGIDVNLTDKFDVPLWDDIKFVFDFQEDSIVREEIGMGDAIAEGNHLYEFFDLAIEHGLNLNAIALEKGSFEYVCPLFWLIYYCYSPKFLSYLISKGADINLVIDKQTLLDRIAEENWFDSEIMESRNVWMEWVYSYLREKGTKPIRAISRERHSRLREARSWGIDNR